MAEIRINATGGVKLYDADDSHYAQIVAGTITSNVNAITLGHDVVSIVDNLALTSDSAVLKFGADNDTTLTHTDGTGLTLNSTNKLTFGDAASFIQQSSDGVLRIDGEATVDINATAAVTIAATGVPVTAGGIVLYRDANDSIYTHDVSGTQSTAEANTSYGVGALDAITTADGCVAIGNGALSGLTTGGSNIAIGKAASNAFDAETHNIAIGLNSLSGAVNGGEYNVSIGNYTLDALTSGDYNTAIGYNAGTAVSTSGSNVYIGGLAGEDHSGENSVIIGRDAALDSTSSNDSVYIGHQSAGGAITTGDDNVCVGKEAGKELTGGAGNTFVGYKAGDTCTTPGGNICVGYEADVSGADQQNAIIIGYNITGGGNTFNFGKASNIVSNTFTSDANWSQSSDLRKKRNIKDDTLGLDFINDLRTVKFQWKPSNELPKECDDYSEENNMDTDVVMHGFIAQEVKSSLDKVGVDTFSGWSVKEDGMQHVSREMFFVPLIKAVQELSAEVKELKAKLEAK